MSEALKSLSSGALRVTTGGTNAGPCTTGTRFQIASISKQFAAAAALTLVRDKQIAVGDKVARWFPHGRIGWDAITVHQLLTHIRGFA